MPTGYSRTQIGLHWAVLLLLVFQYFFHGAMSWAFNTGLHGDAPEYGLKVWAHVGVGFAILGFALWRLALRARRGVPPPPSGDPVLLQRVAHWTHMGLYALLILLPIGGAVAWFGGVAIAGDGHSFLTNVLLGLAGLHVAAALFHQFWRKDHLLRRMMKADG